MKASLEGKVTKMKDWDFMGSEIIKSHTHIMNHQTGTFMLLHFNLGMGVFPSCSGNFRAKLLLSPPPLVRNCTPVANLTAVASMKDLGSFNTIRRKEVVPLEG